MYIPQEIIRKKRDGLVLSQPEIEFMVHGFSRESVPDYQMAALAMAILLKGFATEETAALLESMMSSGIRYDWSEQKKQNRIFVDKHSTGGVGDKTSLIILPLLLSDGLDVPMVAGRGLGHTGGTLDKLESLPGFKTQVDAQTFQGWVRSAHGAFGAQTTDFVPADKKLYALRDVTATVESEALITASIMSKKIAEGIDALVLDVKYGSGAFMATLERAKGLAEKLVAVGKAAGCKVTAALTNMNEPLGRAAGNALEVAECLDVLQGGGPLDTRELSLQLASRVAALARNETRQGGYDKCHARLKNHLQSGRAYELFLQIAQMQGAQLSDLERRNTQWITGNAKEYPVFAATQGVVSAIETRSLGLAIVELGGGRKTKEDDINPFVGLSQLKKIGEEASPTDPLCILHCSSESQAHAVREMIQKSYVLSPLGTPTVSEPLIQCWID